LPSDKEFSQLFDLGRCDSGILQDSGAVTVAATHAWRTRRSKHFLVPLAQRVPEGDERGVRKGLSDDPVGPDKGELDL
jgi:hypothetical protein